MMYIRTLNVCTVRFHEGTLLHALTTEQRFIKAKCLQSLPPSSRQEERISFVSQIFFFFSLSLANFESSLLKI